MLSARAVVDTLAGPLETILETYNGRSSSLGLQVMSKHSEIAVNVAQANGLEGHVMKAKKVHRVCQKLSVNMTHNCVQLRYLGSVLEFLSF